MFIFHIDLFYKLNCKPENDIPYFQVRTNDSVYLKKKKVHVISSEAALGGCLSWYIFRNFSGRECKNLLLFFYHENYLWRGKIMSTGGRQWFFSFHTSFPRRRKAWNISTFPPTPPQPLPGDRVGEGMGITGRGPHVEICSLGKLSFKTVELAYIVMTV